jgi:hypothetical protein
MRPHPEGSGAEEGELDDRSRPRDGNATRGRCVRPTAPAAVTRRIQGRGRDNMPSAALPLPTALLQEAVPRTSSIPMCPKPSRGR